MKCSYREFLQKGNFVFQHETGGERPTAAPKGEPEKPKDALKDTAQKALTHAEGALAACDAVSCKVEITKGEWQKEADEILGKIQQDGGLVIAFNSFLKEYARKFGQESFELTEDAASNFYNALEVSGVPDSAVGFETAWNDILHIAEQGVAESTVKKPYERLKSVIAGVKNKGKSAQASL